MGHSCVTIYVIRIFTIESSRMKLLTVFIFQFSIGFLSFSQGLPIEKAIDSLYESIDPQILVLGENHTKNNTPHYTKSLRHLYHSQGVRTVAWEFPKSFELQMNNFLLHGDELVFKSLDKISMMNKKDHYRLMDSIREMNLTFAKDDMIHVVCFDIETDVSDGIFKGIKRFLQPFRTEDLSALDLIMKEYSYYAAEVESACASMARVILSDQVKYKAIFGKHYMDLLYIIEGTTAETVYTDNDDWESLNREKFMTKMMVRWQKNNPETKLLLICGAAHGSFDMEYDWEGGHQSMIYNLMYEHNISVYSVRTLYYDVRLGIIERFFPDEISGLEIDLKLAFQKNDPSNYLFFFEGDIEDSNEFNERYNGVLVKNCHGKKR